MKRQTKPNSTFKPEQSAAIQATVFQLVEKALPSEYFLVDVEFGKELGYWFLRLYIDLKAGSISIQQCEALSRQLEPAIEALPELTDGAYNLEVSSPGLFRPLKTEREFGFFTGEPIRITGESKLKNKKKAAKALPDQLPTLIEGTLLGFRPESQTVLFKPAQSDSIVEWKLEVGQAVYLNPVIHFPDEDGTDLDGIEPLADQADSI